LLIHVPYVCAIGCYYRRSNECFGLKRRDFWSVRSASTPPL
jgi:hypothetical protein